MNKPAITFDRSFPADYEIEALLEEPGWPLLSPRRTTFGYDRGVLLAVRPRDGDEWIMDVAGGPPARVFSCPNPRQVAVLCDDGGVLVSADWPPDGILLKDLMFLGATGAVAALSEGVLVIHDAYSSALALGRDGIIWQTRLDGADGLRLDGVCEGVVHGHLMPICEAHWVPFMMDLQSGERTS